MASVIFLRMACRVQASWPRMQSHRVGRKKAWHLQARGFLRHRVHSRQARQLAIQLAMCMPLMAVLVWRKCFESRHHRHHRLQQRWEPRRLRCSGVFQRELACEERLCSQGDGTEEIFV